MDQFRLIAEWHHLAILEIVTLNDFKPTPEWIAKRLGIGLQQTRESLELLIQLGYLRRTKNGFLEADANQNTFIGPDIVNRATQIYQSQILNKALDALHKIPIERRSQSGVTMAIPSSRIKEAKEIIIEFRRQMTGLMQRKGKRDEVYQLSISFFPLTQLESE